MSLGQEAITQQFALLATHRRTLAHLIEQAAQFGGEVFAPPQTANGIAEARQQIRRIKAALRKNGARVEDDPNDRAPRPRKPAQAHHPNDLINGDTVAGDKVGGDKLLGDKTAINTEGGDYAEGNIDKRQGAFVNGSTIYGPVVGINQGTVTANYTVHQHPDPVLHQFRAPVGDFVGREQEIDQLVQALSKAARGNAAAVISGVRGMGGIGKTELAYVVGNRLKDAFPDAQLLIELRGASQNPLTPEAALQAIIHAFEREAKLPDDLSQLKALYSSVLTGKRVLIFADDAKDVTQVHHLLPPTGCALLVTSRNRFSLPGMMVLDLGALRSDAAEQLLLEICPRIGTHARQLATLCGELPLALRVSASLLANSSRSVERYLELLVVERLKHLSDPDDPTASVEASLRLSFDTLEPTAQAALTQMSVFPVSFDAAAATEVVAVEGDVTEILDLLQRRSLLELDAKLERYSLHDLVQVFAAARLEDADTVRLRHARHYAQVAAFAEDELYFKGEALAGLALFDQERRQIAAGGHWVRERAGEQEADALILEYAEATATIGGLRDNTQRERIPQFEAQLAAAQRLKRRDIEGEALNNLGLAYYEVGDERKACVFFEQYLVIARELGNRRSEGIALGSLGDAYYRLGDLHKAINFHEQNIAIARELRDLHAEGSALGSLAPVYAALGDYRQALTTSDQWLAVARKFGDRRSEGIALGNLGNCWYELRQPRKAISFHEQALAIAHELGDRRSERRTLDNLGNDYYVLWDVRQAVSFHEQALAIAHELEDWHAEGSVLVNLGRKYLELGEKGKASERLRSAEAICVDLELPLPWVLMSGIALLSKSGLIFTVLSKLGFFLNLLVYRLGLQRILEQRAKDA